MILLMKKFMEFNLLKKLKEGGKKMIAPRGNSLLRIFMMVFFCVCFVEMGFAQNKTITGKITEANGDPIIGASVKVNGTNTGAITDTNGEFSLTVSEKAILDISYLGFKSKRIPVGTSDNFTITLDEDVQGLDEVVVVGYGTQKKATLTGSVAAVNNKEITITKNENVVNMLAGKIPGVRITQLSSRPGAFATNIDIRGLGTPLVVVDGIPRDVDYFQRMDATSIENVSVLKDASAAVYGLRSANGVILVTTKRGSASAGGFNIQYTTNYGWQQFLQVPNNVDAVKYMTLSNEKNWRDFNGNFISRKPALFSAEAMQPYIDGTLQSTDWMKAVFKTTTPQYQHNITVDGGNNKVNYYFNLGYMNQDGALKTNAMNYNRWNFQSNIDAHITKRLTASVSLGGYKDEMNEPLTDIWAVYKNVWIQRPDVPVYANNNPLYINGDMKVTGATGNPVAITDQNMTGYRKYARNQFTGQLAISYDIPGIEGLTAKGLYSYNFQFGNQTYYSKPFIQYFYNPTTDVYTGNLYSSLVGVTNATIRRIAYPSYSTLMQLSLNYKRTFAKAHNLNVIALYEEEYGFWDNFYAYRELTLNSQYLFVGNDLNQQGNMYAGSLGDQASKAFVGKLNYDYQGKYLVEFSFRYDGSSKFPIGKRWGLFSAGSVGYRISEEPFFKNALPFIDNFKLRASYGKTGDDTAASLYPPDIVGYQVDPANLGWIFGAGGVTGGVRPTAIPNPNLTWYTAKMFNIGLDADLWNGLLGGSIDYFKRNRDGLITKSLAVIPGTTGAEMPQENLESDRTFGFDMSLSHRYKIGSVGYYVTGVVSATRNQWRNRIQTPSGNSFQNWQTRQQNRYKDIWWGQNYEGRFQNYQQIYNYALLGSGITGGGGNVPGDYYYQDWNGDGVINGNDNHPIATYGMPLFNYGLTLGANWNNFDLSVNFQGAAGIYYQYTEGLGMPLWNYGGAMTKFMDRWHPADPNADIFDPSTQWIPGRYPTTGSSLPQDVASTLSVENASYVRLKTIELGYSIPKKLLTKAGIKDLRIYFSGYNMLTFTGLKNMDPEHPGGAGGPSADVYSNYMYPNNKTYNIGASIKF